MPLAKLYDGTDGRVRKGRRGRSDALIGFDVQPERHGVDIDTNVHIASWAHTAVTLSIFGVSTSIPDTATVRVLTPEAVFAEALSVLSINKIDTQTEFRACFEIRLVYAIHQELGTSDRSNFWSNERWLRCVQRPGRPADLAHPALYGLIMQRLQEDRARKAASRERRFSASSGDETDIAYLHAFAFARSLLEVSSHGSS